VYSRASAAHSESPSTPSAAMSDRSLRHVGEGALDDSDSSEGGDDSALASADSRDSLSENEMDIMVEVPQRPIMSKSRSLSMGRTGPVHPSPLSRLAGQRWTEDDDDGGSKEREEDEASPSPGSTDTDGGDESGRDSESSTRPQKVRVGSVSATRTRPRNNSAAKQMKSRTRRTTVAALAVPSPSSVSSPLLSAPASPNQLEHASHSSVRTVTAGSVREQDLQQHDDDAVQADAECITYQTWCDMTESQRRAVMEEEAQLREVAWCALRDAVDGFAEAVSDCLGMISYANGVIFIGRCSNVCYAGTRCSQGTEDQPEKMFAFPRGIYW